MEDHTHKEIAIPEHWPKNMPFRLPPDYFSHQRISIMRSLQHEWQSDAADTPTAEVNRISPVLGKLKQQGIKGRWNDKYPEIQPPAKVKQPAEQDKSNITAVKAIHGYRSWLAAASLAGLLLLGKFILERQEINEVLIKTNPSTETLSDASGFSEEDIKSYLSETEEYLIERDQNPSGSSNVEPFLAHADLLASTEVFTQKMNHIPIQELEAYINELPDVTEY
jgi:hypothetical protein